MKFKCVDCGVIGREPQPDIVKLYCRSCKSSNCTPIILCQECDKEITTQECLDYNGICEE